MGRLIVPRRVALVAGGAAAIAAALLYRPTHTLEAVPVLADSASRVPIVEASPLALGASGNVRMQFVRAGGRVAFPLRAHGSPVGFTYQWVRSGTADAADVARPLVSDTLLAPLEAGFFDLLVVKSGVVQRITEPRLAVMIPFELKLGSTLNGYRIGRYPAEWSKAEGAEVPAGFAEVRQSDLELPLSTHMKVRDFITHDAQTRWPKYIAVDPRLLDKLELVLREIARRRGEDVATFSVGVHSAFRTPEHNSGVEGAARDSRHLYGDAADVAIDADGDRRMTIFDAYQVESAVEWVEKLHPDLAGGLGVYSSKRFSSPYTHIDARGTRKRWRG